MFRQIRSAKVGVDKVTTVRCMTPALCQGIYIDIPDGSVEAELGPYMINQGSRSLELLK